MEPAAWAFRHVRSVTAAAPTRKTPKDANVDRDMTAGTVQSQVRMLSTVTNTSRPTKRKVGDSTRTTLSAGASAGRRTETSREAFARRYFSEAGGCSRRRKAQERICSLPQLLILDAFARCRRAVRDRFGVMLGFGLPRTVPPSGRIESPLTRSSRRSA